jgi:large subunit ribosomal protein L3
MPNTRQPRAGSLQFWPRKRTKRTVARVRTHAKVKDKIDCFVGYKVGMTHVQAIETNKNSHMKGAEVSIPVTVVECPPVRIATVRFYKKVDRKPILKKEIALSNDKVLARSLSLPKTDRVKELETLDLKLYDDVRAIIYTMPGMTGIGKKNPDLAEVAVGGKDVEEKLKYVKEHIGKDITFDTLFQDGEMVDIKSITKGKGFEGPVARFGVAIRRSKSEKSIRNPGSLGPWRGQGHIMWRVAHAGKTGYAQRTEYNKQILKYVSPDQVNPKGGFVGYGLAKNPVVLVKGSIPCPRNRAVLFEKATRIKKVASLPTIEKISREEKQGI